MDQAAGLPAPPETYRGRSVLLASEPQLETALALAALDGVA